MERIILEVFLPFIGSHGFNVYSVLCSGTYEAEVKMTLREIGEKAHVGKDTVSRTLRTMSALGMIGIKKPRGQCRTPEYELYSLREAAACGVEGLRAKLEAAELKRTGHRCPKKKLELVDNGSGTFVFEESDVETLVSQGDTESTAAKETESPFGVSQGDTELPLSCPIRETPKTLESHTVSHLGETPFNTKKEKEIKNNHPNPSASGRACETRSEPSTTEDPEGPVRMQRVPDSADGPPPLAGVLDRLGGLRPRLGDVEDLRGQIESHMATAGFDVRRDARIADRGDGRAGTVDLWCERGSVGEDGEGKPEFVAFELDSAVARDRSLMKLRVLGTGVHRVIVLRTGLRGESVVYSGINRVLSLGWPGNGQAERLEARQQAAAAAMARARVGQAMPPANGETGAVRETPGAGSVRALLAEIREGLAMYGEEALAEWDAAFAGVSYERHEAVEGAATGVLLVLSSGDPPATLRGMEQFAGRLEPALAARFGGKVQAQVTAWDGAVSAAGEDAKWARWRR